MDADAGFVGRLRRVLEAREHSLHAAFDEAGAWRLLRELGGADLLLLDPAAGRGSGLELLQKVRANALLAAMPVSICTREKSRALVAEALELGVQNYLIKPAKPAQLLAEILKAERIDWRTAHFEPIPKVCAAEGILKDDYPSLVHAALESVIQCEVALRGGGGPDSRKEKTRSLAAVTARASQLGFEALGHVTQALVEARATGDTVSLENGLGQLRLAGKVIEARQRSLPFSSVWVPRKPDPEDVEGRGGEAVIDVVSVLQPTPAPSASEAEAPIPFTEAVKTVLAPSVEPEEAADSELAQIARGQPFPVFASVANAIGRLLQQDDLDLEQVTAWISREAGLTTRVLSLANSGYVAPATPIEDVRMAVQLLGTRRVRVLTASLNEGADLNRQFTGFDWQAFWSHQVGCAILCEDVLEVLNAPALPGIYLAGLLHDVGKILLSQRYAEAYKKALALALAEGRPLVDLERDLFETDHEAIGAFYAEENGLPEPFPSVIGFHGKPQDAPLRHQPAVATVAVANWLCKRHGLGFSGTVLREPEPTLKGTPAWELLQEWAQPMLGVERFERQMERRVARARYELHSIARELEGRGRR